MDTRQEIDRSVIVGFIKYFIKRTCQNISFIDMYGNVLTDKYHKNTQHVTIMQVILYNAI